MKTEPSGLLTEGETAIPSAVERTHAFFERTRAWVRFARNGPATSCRDAAQKRQRLGHIGIELHDELKSFVGSFRDENGHQVFFLAHCRGDRKLDLDRLRQALGASDLPLRLDEHEAASLGLAYGLVNPFGIQGREGPLLGLDLIQVFDEEIIEDCGLPNTMMTNAGDLTWAVEFKPCELVAALPRSRVAHIAEPDPELSQRPLGARRHFKLGIITGNSPESGISLWSKINDAVRARENFLGDISLPEVVVHSLPVMGLTMELDLRHDIVWPRLRAAIESFRAQDVTTIAIACNTTQYFVPRLRDVVSGVEIISLPEVVAEHIRASSFSRIALVGIEYVTDLHCGWSGYQSALDRFEIEKLGPEVSTRLREIAYAVKRKGPSSGAFGQLRRVLNRYVSSPVVVLALTELSLLLQYQRAEPAPGKQIMIDPLAIFANELANIYCISRDLAIAK